MQSIAEKLKAVRLRRGLTLKTVATAIGVSESMISQIERGQVSPSIDTLLGLAETLEVRLEYLFEGTGPAKSASVVRGEDRVRLVAGGVTYDLLSADKEWDHDHGIQAFRLLIEPGGEKGDVEYGHQGREFGFIMSGEAELVFGRETHRLRAGDSVSFASDTPHVLRSAGNEAVQALWIVTPPRSVIGDRGEGR